MTKQKMGTNTRRFSNLDYNDTENFKDSIWKCTTNEACYKSNTLVGNWNESHFDVKFMARNRPLPSSFGHYYETSHQACYTPPKKLEGHGKSLKYNSGGPRSFPGHQPELTSPMFQSSYKNLESTSMAAYKHPGTLRE